MRLENNHVDKKEKLEKKKNFKVCVSQDSGDKLSSELCCAAAACFEPGDCIFTAALTAVAFHSGDRWKTICPDDTQCLQSSDLQYSCKKIFSACLSSLE